MSDDPDDVLEMALKHWYILLNYYSRARKSHATSHIYVFYRSGNAMDSLKFVHVLEETGLQHDSANHRAT